MSNRLGQGTDCPLTVLREPLKAGALNTGYLSIFHDGYYPGTDQEVAVELDWLAGSLLGTSL
jgi:hypothetical protein